MAAGNRAAEGVSRALPAAFPRRPRCREAPPAAPTYILLLKLARQVALHEGCLPGAAVAHQDELELDLRLSLGGHRGGSFQKSLRACPTGAGKMAEARSQSVFLTAEPSLQSNLLICVHVYMKAKRQPWVLFLRYYPSIF